MSETNGPRDERDRAGSDEPEADSLEALRDAVAAYALDAVEADERAAVERALADDAELRDEADGFAETAALLAGAPEPVEPPPALKSRLMAQLDGLPQQLPDASAPATPAVSPAQVESPLEPPRPDLAPEPAAPRAPGEPGPAEHAARRRWFQRPGVIIAAAAASVVLIGGAIIGVAWTGPNGWGAQREMAAIAEAPDVESSTHEIESGGAVTLYWSAEQGRSGVVVEGLPDVGESSTYELWYIDDAGAQSAGTFDVAEGETWRVLEGDFAPGVAVGVTVEPAGGSPQPTTEPIVVIPT
ncbi:anti-sigma factor [Agromyces cerinus]|uniref:Regulator of SigK n=1 Tax=Agromyces cerinus subsp. cerinus TaxID=232089 RepID=A0A1N6FK06_9MICO|nr:anti-sigma factor [Agromyces cerinus]SIN95585.1 Anti-sigma-K factor rskA [Agromyces cerinus subsp. cerinus]